MTKQVRIENADMSSYPVRVTLQDKNANGEWVDATPGVQPDCPTNMTSQYIHSTRRIVIEERPAEPPASN